MPAGGQVHAGEPIVGVPVVAPADHRGHEARARVDRGERPVRVARLGQHGVDRALGGALHPGIQRRHDPEAALEQQVVPVGRRLAEPRIRQDPLLDVVDEVRRDVLLVALGRQVQHDGGGAGCQVARRVDHPELEHPVQHPVATPLRAVRMRDGVVVHRRLDQTGEQRGVRERELQWRLVEVRLGRGLDAVRAVAEVHGVQVLRQDPVLAQPLLELPREVGLLDLPADRLLLADVDVLHELLGDGRPALDDLAGGGVDVGRAQERSEVDPLVVVEPLVLDRDDRVPHDVGDPPRTDDDAVLAGVQAGDERPVRREQERRLGQRVRVAPRLSERRQIARRGCEGERDQADHEGPRASGHGPTILPRRRTSHC